VCGTRRRVRRGDADRPSPPAGPSVSPHDGAPGGRFGSQVPDCLAERQDADDRHLDVAVDELLAVLVDVAPDVVDEATPRGQADALGGQVVDDVGAALDAAVDEGVDVGLDGVVHPLEQRGHDHLGDTPTG
jgi:hypothetical protein